MADPKKPKQLSEADVLVEFTSTGNIYVDPAYASEETTPATSPITGEALVFGENTLANFTVNNNSSPALNPEDGHATFVSNLKRGTARGAGHDFFFSFNRNKQLNDVYITNSEGGDFSASPRVADKYFADTDGTLSVYIENSVFGGNLMGFGSQTDTSQKFTGNYEFTFKNSQTQWFCITYGTGYGMGEGGAGNVRFGSVYGNIDLLVDGSTVTNNGVILAGGLHPGDDGAEKAYLRAYIKDSLFQGEFGVIKTGVDGTMFKSEADVDITIEGSTFANVFLMFPNVATNTQARNDQITTTGDVNFKATNTRFAGLNMGAGLGGTGWNRTGWIKGNINFDISGSSNSSRTFIHKGFIGTEDEHDTVTGTLTNSVFGDFTGYDTRENNYIYADTTITMTASTIGNFTFYNTINSNGAVTPTAGRVFGDQTLVLAGVVAGSVAGNGPGAEQGDATFNLVVNASETLTQVGAISRWGTITLRGANLLSATSLSEIGTLSVVDETLAGDVILVSGLTAFDEENIETVLVNGSEYTYGVFGGQYSFMGGNLVAHVGETYVINSNYSGNGITTSLGLKGYKDLSAAQAASATSGASLAFTVLDEEVEPTVFTADVVTKDYSTSFVGTESESVSLGSFSIIVGDTAADVASANVMATYTTDINSVKFGNVTGTASLSMDHAGVEETVVGSIDLTGAAIGDLQVGVTESFIGDLILADNAATKGKVTISKSVIENVYGGTGDVEADLTGGNTITNVFAEGQGSKIKLAGSEVDTYTAGYSASGSAVDVLTFSDSVDAKTLIVGGNENAIGKIEATIGGGSAELLKIGGTGDIVSGDVDLTLAGGKFTAVSIAEDATVNGAINVNLAGGTVATIGDTFYGLIYGASVTGALDGGSQGTKRTLNVLGHAKVEAVSNFDELNVTGGTLNVAGGDRKSDISEANILSINGDILNQRTINAGIISAVNVNNYGAIGTLRKLDAADTVALNLTGNLNNYDVVLTASANIGGNLVNTGKITALGDITVNGTFNNSGDIYFYAVSSREGVFSQNGGLALNNVDLVNTGFISAGTLTGVKNLTTSKMYVTGGAEISGNITIDAGAEVCFTNKANPEVANGLTLGGAITMGDTSNLVVSGDLSTTGTATITVNCGDLIGVNEIVRAEGGVNSWTIKLAGANAGNYQYVKTDTSVLIYSTDQLFVNSAFSEDADCFVDGHKLLYGKNAFTTVEDAVAAAKAGAKIVIAGDKTGMDVSAAAFDVVIDGSIVGDVTAKSISVTSDSTVKSIVSASNLTIKAGALLSVIDTIPEALAIVIDATAGTGSRLVLDVDSSKVTLDVSKVTINGKAAYSALVLSGEGETAPAHAGDLFIISSDNAYYVPAFYTDVEGTLTPNFVDGDTFDAATGDALFNGVNTFGVRADAVAAAKAAGGLFVIVDNLVNNAHGDPAEGVPTAFEVDFNKGGADQQRAIVGVWDPSDTSIPLEGEGNYAVEIIGTTSRGNIYGLARNYNVTGDFSIVIKDTVQTTNGSAYLTGNNASNVFNGNIRAEITNSTLRNTGVVGTVGTEDFNPVNVDIVIRDSTIGSGTGNDNGFYGLSARDTNASTKYNANVNISIFDSMVTGAFYGIRAADWVADNANIYQASFISGGINVEVGGTTVNNTFRAGDSLPHGANALQTFNVPTTLHVVATEKSPYTRADWVMEWDTIIIDADATLQLGHRIEYTTAYKDANSSQDNGGQLIQIYVNMSGYAGGTRSVIVADLANDNGQIDTDASLSNISVIGDNDMTGQRQLVYGFRSGRLTRVAVFDKADDMYVNTAYNDDTSGTVVGGQELYFNANAHDNVENALVFANDWGGTIIITGGTFEAKDFNGNNVDLQNGLVESITMGDRQASTLKVEDKGTFGSADGSGKSAIELSNNAVVGDIANFTSVSISAAADITASSLNLSDATITIDVNKFAGRPHAVITTEGGITGYSAANVTFTGKDADKYGTTLVDGKILVLTTTIQSDTYLNSTYSDATTGTFMPDGTYLQYGFNAFTTFAEAKAALGSVKNTITVTGGEFTGDFQLAGSSFAMEDGIVSGIIYGTEDDDLTGMNITLNGGTIGGIDLTAGDGAYSVSKAALTFTDGVTVKGNVIGGGDTTLTVDGGVKTGGLEGLKQITISTSSLLEADYIELQGATVFVTGGAVESTEGNLRKIISTQAGINGVAAYSCDPGLTVYASGKDVYLMDLSHIYFDPTFTEAITGTTMANGDVLQWGSNAFNDFATALGKVTQNTGTLYVSNYTGDVVNNTTASAINLNISGGSIGTFRPISGDRSTAKIYSPITIDIDGATLTAGIDYILGRGNSWDNVGNSLVYYAPVTVNLSNGRNNDNLRFVGQWSTFAGGLTLNLTNWDLRGDFKPIVGDSRAGASDDAPSFLDVTFDNVTVGNAGAKWIGLANVTDWGPLDHISLTVKNSTIMTGTGGNNMRVCAFDAGNDGRHGSAVPIFFTVEDSHINALFSAANLDVHTTNSGSYATLTIKGSTSYIKWANWFQELDMSVGTLLTGGTITMRDGGLIKIDATGYTGSTTLLISLSDGFTNDTEAMELELTQDVEDQYELVAGKKGVVLWDKTITDIYTNPDYSAESTGSLVGDGILLYEKNAFSDLETAKAAVTAGNKLYVTGGDYNGGLFGTLADGDATPFVDLVVTNGVFSDDGAILAAAEEGKTVTGNARIEIAGGTFGKAPVVEEGEVVEPAVLVSIDGSKDAVGGTSELVLNTSARVYANITNFDKMSVVSNARVAGDITVDALDIDCNATLTVDGILDVGAIHLVSADYTGPSKVVLTSDSLKDLALDTIVTVDGTDKFYFDGERNLWLVSEDPGNIYICTGFDESINGKAYNGDLLYYGINAFKTLDAEALTHTTSDYTVYVLDGNYSEVIDLTGLGQVQLQLDGGSFAGFKVGDGDDADHRSTVRITASTSAVTVGSLAGVEGSTIGYRVIANKDAAITSVDGIQYLRIGVDKNVSITDVVNYITSGGQLVVDLAGYTAGAASVLAPANGINNFIQLVEGETFSRTTVGAQNNGGYVVYYDEAAKSVKVVPNGNVIVLDKTNNNSTYYNGQTVVFDGQTTALVYGYNVSDWNFGGLSQQIPLDGKLEVKEGYWFSNFFTQPIRTIELSGSTIEWMSAGPNEEAAPADRTGNYSFTAENSRFQGWAYLAGRGTSGTHMGVIVGTYDEESGEYIDGVYNIVLKDTVLATGTGDFNVFKYANVRGGTANVTMENFQIEGDFQLFNYVYNYEGESLDEVNVSIKNAQCPAAKWMGIWDPQDANETTVNLYITDANFIGDDNTLGLFGTHANADWNGDAHVYISGLTMGGRLSGARGHNGDGNANNILGTRTLHVIGTDNTVRVTREFTTIDIEDGAVLKGDTILMPGTASGAAFTGFILRGQAGYTGEVKEYAVMGATVNGVGQYDAQFLDADDNEITTPYAAIVGNTNVFIYRTDGDVYFSSNYNALTTGATVTEADGTKNFLVYGDHNTDGSFNAVNGMRGAYAAVDARGGSDKAAIQVVDSNLTNLYTYGYRTIVNSGTIRNVVGGTNATTVKVDSGEVDGDGNPIMVDELVPAPTVDSVNITVKKEAAVTNISVSGETYSAVTGDALVTIADGTEILGTVFGGATDYVGGASKLVFEGDATVKVVNDFDSVTLNANSVVTLSGAFSAAAITIDASKFADFTKKVLVAEGGFGEGAITVNVIGTGFGYQFLDDGKTLVVTSDLVGNTYVDTTWTEADVHNKFVGDMALVWNKNAFNSVAAAAAAIGEGSTLYIEGGNSTEAVTLTKKNDVIVSANTTGTAVGTLTADGGTLTVSTDFTATEINGFSGIALNAVDNITIGAITLAENGTITIDTTGYTQEATDAAVLTVANGITGLTDENIVLTGEGSGAFHAYYSHIDNSIHTMRIDNFYVDTAFGTAGEGIVEGQTNPITGETLLWGVNAFYYLNDALGKMAPGQGLYINGRDGNNVNTRGEVANIYLTNSNIPVIINGYTNGDRTYVGDICVTIQDSTFGTAAGSYLLGYVTDGEPWNHQNRYFGSATVNVIGSTVGGNANAILVTGCSFNQFYGTEEAPALIQFNFKDSVIRDDLLFIGDSPVGKTVEIDGKTYIGANLEINFENVYVPNDKWWRIQDGDQESEGTVTVNIKGTTIGKGDQQGQYMMRFSLGDWSQATPRSYSDFIFNVENSQINGNLSAGRADADFSELPGYTGAKTLNLAGVNSINYTYWFKTLNLSADASLTGRTLRMASSDAVINIDVTGYTGSSKVFISMDNAFENVTLDDITVIGLDPEAPAYQIVTDYDETAETPTLTTVVLKGAFKDIYVNGEYTEELKLGASYNGEALFYGENAFTDIATAAPALTDGATLYITGGKAATDLALTNAITIDASAQLTYRGATALSIAGDVVNAGTILVSAKNFIVTGLESDVLVLTATSITGDGVYKTDNSAYSLNVVGNELHLLAKKTDVFVNTAWADLAEGDVVEVAGGTAIIGTDAFATADAAAAVVSVKGSITVIASKVSFTNAITCTVTATEGSTIENASVGASAAGTLILQSGAVATNASVRGTGTLTVEAGAKVTGGLGMLEGAAVSFAEGAILDIDITSQPEGESASVKGFSIITGTPTITVTMAADQKDGTYALATDAASFNSTVTLQTTAAKIADLTLGETVQVDGIDYTLALTDNNDLALTKAVYIAPITVTYVNDAWATLADGAVVTVSGGTAVIGYDAFATGDAAIAAVVAYGEVKVVGGNVSFTDAIAKTVTINAEATLVGKATFATAVTINGTVAFDTANATAEAAQFGGFSFVSGDATYTLTAAAVKGTYLLASDAAGFNSDVVFGDVTLKVGAEAVVIGDFTYALGMTDNNELALVIGDKPTPPPTPSKPASSDIDGNGISDVMFVWTGNNYQHGYWMNGTSEWQSAGSSHPAEWENLGCYDMTGNGKADSVLVGNVTTETTGKGAYIGFYTDAIDNPDGSTWQNIGYLTNVDDIAWKNKVGNLTGNENANSIVWYAPELYALGAWTDGTESWVSISNSFGGTDWTLVGCGDFDGDGKDSILMSGLNGQYLYSVGIDEEAKALGSANWSGWDVRAIGDFSGDGKDDLVLFHLATGSMVMCADGNIDSFVSLAQLDAEDWFVVGAGDYNGDQKDDLLVRQYSTGMLGYYNSGDTAQWVELGRGVDMNWTVIA